MPRTSIPRPANEAQRLSALQRYRILDTPNDPDFDFLTELAAHLCNAPYACVVLVDAERVWLKSAVGLRQGAERHRDDDYCAWTILEPAALHLRDVQADPRTASLPPTREMGYRMYSGVNLHVGDGLHVGTLCVLDTQPRELPAIQRDLLQRLGRQVMALIELRAAQLELQAKVEALDRLSRHDELTGLMNRRALMQALERELARAQRFGSPLSVLLIDVDHFKQINDGLGHAMGDEVLRRLAAALKGRARSIDMLGRLGGEEFVVVMPNTTLQGSLVLADAARRRIEALDIPGMDRRLTISVGVSSTGPWSQTAAELLQAADKAMYQAKSLGRNRVVAAEGRNSLAA